jgi:hypothetical protein
MDEIIEDLDDYRDASPEDDPTAKISGDDKEDSTAEQLKPAANTSHVLCVASRSPLDQTAASMLAQILTKRGASAVSLPYERAGFESSLSLDNRAAKLICLSYFGAASKPAHVRYIIRRLRRLMPQAKFVACFWMLRDERTKLEEWKAVVNADFAVSSLEDAATICCAEILSAGEADMVSTDANVNSVRSAA